MDLVLAAAYGECHFGIGGMKIVNVSDKKQRIFQYCQSFDPTHLYTVIQFFEWFECCEDLIPLVQGYINSQIKQIARIKRRAREQFEKAGMPLMSDEEREIYLNAPCLDEETADHRVMQPGQEEGQILHERMQEPQTFNVVVGFCPKCNSTMVGSPMPPCESDETGRHFYSECTVCPYYTEVFKGRKGRYIEIKGG